MLPYSAPVVWLPPLKRWLHHKATSVLLLQNVLTSSLSSPSEDVKAVASQALGGVAIGNLAAYLPFILQQIQSQVQLSVYQTIMARHACIPTPALPHCAELSAMYSWRGA